MKRFLKTIALIIVPLTTLNAQDVKNQAKAAETKMEVFASKTGTIIKFVDYKLPNLKLFLGQVAETRIRRLTSSNETQYFYQIEKAGQYASNTASIEYSDLIEIIKAFATLKGEYSNDIVGNSDYIENKFVTTDGFQVGYYVSDGKSRWYLKLEKYGSDNTVFINDFQTIETAFNEAKDKIELLKK